MVETFLGGARVMKERVLRLVAFSVLLIASQVVVFGQTTGSISGTVSDPNGAVVAGANVTLKNNATGAERTAVAKDNGSFSFTAPSTRQLHRDG